MDKNWNNPMPAVWLSWLVRRERAQFFYLREIGWGGAYDIGLTLKVEKMSQWKRKNNYLVRLLETILQP